MIEFQFVKRDDYASRKRIVTPLTIHTGVLSLDEFLKKKSTVIMLGILIAIVLMSFIYPTEAAHEKRTKTRCA